MVTPKELQELGIEDFFLYCTFEGKRLLSGNLWGSKMGRSFSFDLETHKFFDFSNPQHSGTGLKKLFELRGEKLPERFRLHYARYSPKEETQKRIIKSIEIKERVYIKGPLPVPPQMTPPKRLTHWNKETQERIEIPAKVYAYKNLLGQTVGFLLKGREKGKSIEIVRPLSVWERLVGPNSRTLLSYRQKAFEPFPYKAEYFLAEPEAKVVVVEGEDVVDFFLSRRKGVPILFTTWPFGKQGFFLKEVWKVLKGREVVLLPSPKEDSLKAFAELKKEVFPAAKLLNPFSFNLQPTQDLRDIVDLQHFFQVCTL